MMAVDEEALICDFAETYHIYDFKSLPAKLAAILAMGMRDDSRIKKRLRGDRLSREEGIMAMIYDLLSEYMWALGGKENPAPKSMYLMLSGEEEPEEKSAVRGFSTPEEYEEERKKLIGG